MELTLHGRKGNRCQHYKGAGTMARAPPATHHEAESESSSMPRCSMGLNGMVRGKGTLTARGKGLSKQVAAAAGWVGQPTCHEATENCADGAADKNHGN